MTKLRVFRSGLSRFGLVTLAGMALAAGSTAAQAQSQCNSTGDKTISNQSGDDTARLEAALQDITNRGGTLTISPGTYDINRVLSPNSAGKSGADSGVRVKVRKSFNVIATGATFRVGGNMAGDVFSIDTDGNSFVSSQCGSTSGINITWTGGTFDLKNMQVSTTVPVANLTTDQPTSSQSTGDALSFRGTATRNGARTTKISNVTVSGIRVDGASSTGSWRTAGGDSGVFIGAVGAATVENSGFYGTRDAGIYFSGDNTATNIGRNYIARGIRVERSFDGITSKRGADSITFDNNDIVDTVIPLSIKRNIVGRVASNVTFSNNRLTRCTQCMLVERGNTVTITGNSLFEIGNPTAGDSRPLGGRYEGVALEGTSGSTVSNNRFNAVGGSRAGQVTTWAIVRRSIDGVASTAPTTSGNVFNGTWDRTNTSN